MYIRPSFNTEMTEAYRYWDERPPPVKAEREDMPCIVAWVAVVLGVTMGVAFADDAASPVEPARCSYLPEGLLGRVVYYHSFSRGVKRPEVNRIGASHRIHGKTGDVVDGFWCSAGPAGCRCGETADCGATGPTRCAPSPTTKTARSASAGPDTRTSP